MSGGHYDYQFGRVGDLADAVDRERDHRGQRAIVVRLLRGLAEICHDIEWIDSGDYGQRDWHLMVEPKLDRLLKPDMVELVHKAALWDEACKLFNESQSEGGEKCQER